MLGAWHRCRGKRLHLFWVPMDLRHLGAIGERLAVARNAGLVGLDHHGISQDHSDRRFVVTDGDSLPSFIPPELREREPTRNFQCVLVLLSRQADTNQTGEQHPDDQNGPDDLPPLHFPFSFFCTILEHECEMFSVKALEGCRAASEGSRKDTEIARMVVGSRLFYLAFSST